jgi:hypothetical protein
VHHLLADDIESIRFIASRNKNRITNCRHRSLPLTLSSTALVECQLFTHTVEAQKTSSSTCCSLSSEYVAKMHRGVAAYRHTICVPPRNSPKQRSKTARGVPRPSSYCLRPLGTGRCASTALLMTNRSGKRTHAHRAFVRCTDQCGDRAIDRAAPLNTPHARSCARQTSISAGGRATRLRSLAASPQSCGWRGRFRISPRALTSRDTPAISSPGSTARRASPERWRSTKCRIAFRHPATVLILTT